MRDQDLMTDQLKKSLSSGSSWNVAAANALSQKEPLPFRRRAALFIVRQMLAFTIFVSKILGVK